MSTSLTELYFDQKKQVLKKSNKPSKLKSSKKITTANRVDLAPRFKYQMNFPKKDLDEIRRLLDLERKNQNKDEFDFWTADYERMKVDDWLVTRFLLRGQKAAQRLGAQMKSISESSSDEDSEEEYQVAPLYRCTLELVRSCAKFRRDYNINPLTTLNQFPQEWLKVNGLFNYRPDLAGNPTIYLRISLHKPKLIETKELRFRFKRLLLYTLEKCDQDLLNNMGKGVCCIFDMSDATFENIDLELATWMIKSFKNCSPKLLAYVIVFNLPWFFSTTFRLITTTLMSNSNKQCLKFVYGNEILKYIDYSNLPQYVTESL